MASMSSVPARALEAVATVLPRSLGGSGQAPWAGIGTFLPEQMQSRCRRIGPTAVGRRGGSAEALAGGPAGPEGLPQAAPLPADLRDDPAGLGAGRDVV